MVVSIALKEHELELLKAKRKRKKGKTKINDHEILWESDRERNNIIMHCDVILAHIQSSRLRGRKESF